ncbi:MAG: LemA family protein [Acidobacteriota bacterium]
MKRGLLGCLVLLVVAVLLAGLTLWQSYNRLVRLDEAVKSAWAQVENVYQRRADLIPNLVETVKGARDFERETLTAVVEARAKVGQVTFSGVPNAQQFAQFQKAQDELSSALSRLLVVVERYPELRATEAFRDLQAQLEGTENRIAVERKRFNEAAQAYNTYRRRFPQVLIANLLGFAERPYFQATPGAERPPQVRF